MAKITFQARADDVLDLPEQIHDEIPVELAAASRQHYNAISRDFVTEVARGVITAANALSRLLRLQQITGGALPDPLGAHGYIVIGTEKRDALADLLESAPVDEPVVVFGRFHADLDAIREARTRSAVSPVDRGRSIVRKYFELSGRRDDLAAWQSDGGGSVLAVQIQSGGAGIDLTRARYCVYYSLGFSLGDYEQSLKRLHRPGQTRAVHYYHLVARSTVDQQVYKALRNKKIVVDAVLDAVKKGSHC